MEPNEGTSDHEHDDQAEGADPADATDDLGLDGSDAPPGRRERGSRSMRVVLGAVLAAAAVAVAAVLGVNALSSNGTAANATAGYQSPGGGMGRPGQRGPGAAGTITSIDGSTIVMRSANGQTANVTTSATTVTRAGSACVSDLKVGDQITVVGN